MVSVTHALPLEGPLHDPLLVGEVGEEVRAGLQRQLGRVHLRLLDGVTLVLGESLTAEIHGHCVDPEVKLL